MCRITYILCDGCVTLSVTGKELCTHPGSKGDGCMVDWVFDPVDPDDCAECAENEVRAREGEGKTRMGEESVGASGDVVGGRDDKKAEKTAEAPKAMSGAEKGKEKAEVKAEEEAEEEAAVKGKCKQRKEK